MRYPIGFVFSAALFASSCEILGLDPPGDITSFYSRVEGSVVDPMDEGVAGAVVRVSPLYNTVQGGENNCVRAEGQAPYELIADVAGDFSLGLHTSSLEPMRCVELEVGPPSGTHLLTQVDTVRMTWGRRRNGAPVVEVSVLLNAAEP